MTLLISISSLTSDAACFEQIRSLRWPNGVICPHCGSQETIRRGKETPSSAALAVIPIIMG